MTSTIGEVMVLKKEIETLRKENERLKSVIDVAIKMMKEILHGK